MCEALRRDRVAFFCSNTSLLTSLVVKTVVVSRAFFTITIEFRMGIAGGNRKKGASGEEKLERVRG